MTINKKDKTVEKLSGCREGRTFVGEEEWQRWWSIRHQEAVLFYAITLPSDCFLWGMAATHVGEDEVRVHLGF